jgi:TPR repeat protein
LRNTLPILVLLLCQACTSISNVNHASNKVSVPPTDFGAQYKLGISYEAGAGVPQDTVQAKVWIERAANQGLAKAQYALASIYLTGHALDDDRVALKWFQIATDQGISQAQTHFGWEDDLVEKMPTDVKIEIVRNYLLAAQQGDAKAQYALAWLCKEWGGNFEVAFYWFQRAADQGHMAAENRLGVFFQQYNDFQKALYWYRKSAQQGYDAAKLNLGIMYWNGQGVQQDKQEAMRLFRLAAEDGYPVAQFDLGVTYLNDKEYLDIPEGVRLLRLAANQGYTQAQDTLDGMHLHQIPSFFRMPPGLAPAWQSP